MRSSNPCLVSGCLCCLMFALSSPPVMQSFLEARAAPAQQTPPSILTAIVGATLIDGSGSSPLADSVVLFQGERITAVGERAKVTIPPNTHVVDGHDKWLIPGLIDMHVHLDEVITPEMFARFGVTSVRDMGSRLVTIQRWRSMRSHGKQVPHVYWMGRNIDEGKPSWWGAVAVKNAHEVPALIDDMARQGVDGVKVYVNAGPNVTAAVIREAHLRGWPVSAHLNNTMPSQAAEMGIDNLEHVSQLFIELKTKSSSTTDSGYGSGFEGVPNVDLAGHKTRHLISELVRHKVAITPTLTASILPVLGERGTAPLYTGWSPVPAEWKREWARPYWSFLTPIAWDAKRYKTAEMAGKKYREMVGMLYRSGVPLIAGTDTPAPWVLPGAGLLVELQLMVGAGVPAAEVLHAATGRAADVLHRADDVGEVVPGRIADIVLLAADPLKDIRNLRKIDAVYMNGLQLQR